MALTVEAAYREVALLVLSLVCLGWIEAYQEREEPVSALSKAPPPRAHIVSHRITALLVRGQRRKKMWTNLGHRALQLSCILSRPGRREVTIFAVVSWICVCGKLLVYLKLRRKFAHLQQKLGPHKPQYETLPIV